MATHDKSTFYTNDKRKSRWSHKSDTLALVRKGEGLSIIAAGFLTSEWGHLTSEDGKEYVCFLFNLKIHLTASFKERQELYSGWVKIGMDILILTIY